MSTRLPETKRLSDILPTGREGGLEFARLVDLLLFYEARRNGHNMMLFSDRAGDYMGLDSFGDGPTRQHGRVGYQYKFYPSPLLKGHRAEIKAAISKAAKAQEKLEPEARIEKWILVTPDDLTESATRKDLGDVSWFESLRNTFKNNFDLEHLGHTKLQALLLKTPSLCLFYYPELVPEGTSRRRSIKEVRLQYDANIKSAYGRIEFVGMSVYKPEATKGVPMEHIYIPLSTVAQGADDRDPATPRHPPMALLHPGSRHVVLGDPGSGKSTLLKFMALAGLSTALQQRYQMKADTRLPILVMLRKYADALKDNINLPLLDYIIAMLRADFSLPHLDQEFLEFYLESGTAILLFDGMDELPNPGFKQTVRDRIHSLLNNYPATSAIITSRIIGYENPYRFDEKHYQHHQLARLSATEMADFVRDWYAVRVENELERKANITDLVRILADEHQIAIRELASNPLLLTIIALVHRIDAVLPDERVVLYQKCTETLLNTWHVWKSATKQQEKRGKTERHNRARIEALAYWMHVNAGSTQAKQRAVVPHEQARDFLREHIILNEKQVDEDDAEDVAEDFLTFIKNSAGLLIEVGDRQYSFIHLTFQEYLTATCLATATEMGGSEALWCKIKAHTREPRWHEVIRLLIAGLKNDASQEFLCERLLAQAEGKSCTHLALLLGGLLQDGIVAAELEDQAIAEYLFAACAAEQEPELLSHLLGLAKNLLQGEQGHSVTIGFTNAWANTKDQTAMLLAGFAVGLKETQLQEITANALALPQFEALKFLLTPAMDTNISATLEKQLTIFYAELAVNANTHDWSNMLAALAEAALQSKMLPQLAFNLRLLLAANLSSGAFAYFGNYPAIINANFIGATLITRARAGAQAGAGVQAEAEVWAEVRARAVSRAEARVRARARGNITVVDNLIDQVTQQNNHTHTKTVTNLPPPEVIWTALQTNKELTNDLLDLCVAGLQLTPALQWKEALRTYFLPQVPTRLWLYQPAIWQEIENKFANNQADENDAYAGAWLMLHDMWLFFYGQHSGPTDSRFHNLAQLTREHPSPQLQIAHCLRDIAYGNKKRNADLKTMLADPAFADQFRAPMWID